MISKDWRPVKRYERGNNTAYEIYLVTILKNEWSIEFIVNNAHFI